MNWKQRDINEVSEEKLLALGKHKLISRLIAQRNIEDPESFLDTSYSKLSHPYSLSGVEKASRLFCDVALKKGSVAVISDYDCDGVVGSVMLKHLCTGFGLSCKVFLPSRLEHGYGLTPEALEAFKKMIGEDVPSLLFVIDCGSNNEKEVKELRELGIETIIVIDHHIIDQEKMSKSADAFISWHLSNNHEMCTCGEVFQFIRGIRWLTKKVDPVEFLSYAAVGTLADVSPLVGDNRIIVKNGLTPIAMGRVTSTGFNALLRSSNIYSNFVTQEDVLFQISPKINAAGRLLIPDIAYRLLVEPDLSTSELMASSLVDCNTKRKALQKRIEKEAIKMVESHPDEYQYGIVVSNYKWHIGVAGIVAFKLVEKFYKPVLVIGENNGIYKGSGRSPLSVNLKAILDDCNHLFDKYGGHATAAGITLKGDCLDVANEDFNKACQKYYQTSTRPEEVDLYDIELKIGALSLNVAKVLVDSLYPYCSKFNPEPVFKLADVTLTKPEMSGSKLWRILNFNVVKDGRESKMRLKMFTSDLGMEVEGKRADIYFKFPQQLENSRYGEPTLNAVDIVVKK